VALLARILVVVFTFLVACVVATVVVTLVVVLPASESIDPYPEPYGFAFVLGLAAMLVSLYTILAYATLPAMLVIALAEGIGLRSVLFYAFAGAMLGCGSVYGWDLQLLQQHLEDDLGGRRLEIAAAIGIVGGFVYWALAGRNAGAWRKPSFHAPQARVHPRA
jgi:hypothetical protein